MTTPIESATSSQPASSEGALTPPRKPKERPVETRPALPKPSPPVSPIGAHLADAGLIVLFLALTFLLGVFPLKDTDIYWHLRTGAWIRQTGQVPRTDLFTFTRVGVPWIDLHWIFQVGVSWLHEWGGVVALNLAKCVVTCVAVLLLVTARRREWPVWVMLVVWLPAILVLGGRIYVRPETLTLLYLSIFLAVVTRWDRHPALAALLPIVQVAWVNSQGLFVLGPIILVCALIDAAFRRGAFALEQRRWWRIVGIAGLATFAACLFNPYGITGALFPIQLAGTMSNPVFSKYIAELIPIPSVHRAGRIAESPLAAPSRDHGSGSDQLPVADDLADRGWTLRDSRTDPQRAGGWEGQLDRSGQGERRAPFQGRPKEGREDQGLDSGTRRDRCRLAAQPDAAPPLHGIQPAQPPGDAQSATSSPP